MKCENCIETNFSLENYLYNLCDNITNDSEYFYIFKNINISAYEIMEVKSSKYLSKSRLLNNLICLSFKETTLDIQFVYQIISLYTQKIFENYFCYLKKIVNLKNNFSKNKFRKVIYNLDQKSLDENCNNLINKAKEHFYNYLKNKNVYTISRIQDYSSRFQNNQTIKINNIELLKN